MLKGFCSKTTPVYSQNKEIKVASCQIQAHNSKISGSGFSFDSKKRNRQLFNEDTNNFYCIKNQTEIGWHILVSSLPFNAKKMYSLLQKPCYLSLSSAQFVLFLQKKSGTGSTQSVF